MKQKYIVLGLGITGETTARFLSNRGHTVVLFDDDPKRLESEEAQALRRAGVDVGPSDLKKAVSSDRVILSPGVPLSHPAVRAAAEAGVPVASEIELAAEHFKTPIIAITGTNGKSTVAMLVGGMLLASGMKTFVGGNLGTPLIAYPLSEPGADWVVAEVSSFQLEAIDRFRPKVSALLNLSEDHLDRHRSFDDYLKAKLRLFENQTEEDWAVLNADDPLVRGIGPSPSPQRRHFSLRKRLEQGIHYRPAGLVYIEKGSKTRFDLAAIRIRGLHNLENIMAAILIAKIAGAGDEAIQRAMEGFRGLPHRIELVGRRRGVSYYDDSKGTNAGAAARSISSFTEPVILIAGGRDKGGDYEPLARAARGRVRRAFLIGEARRRIAAALGPEVKTSHTRTLEDAVARAAKEAREGDVVLLSPACSSFDMFRDYAERGERFQRAVLELPE